MVSEISTKEMVEWLDAYIPLKGGVLEAIRAALQQRDALREGAGFKAYEEIRGRLVSALRERDSLKECNEKYWALMQEQGQALDALKDKYLAATDNLKFREADYADAIQNAAKLATEVNNLKESSQFNAYKDMRLRLHDALRERDEWRDKAMEKRRRIGCECPNCHAQLSVMGVVVADEEGK